MIPESRVFHLSFKDLVQTPLRNRSFLHMSSVASWERQLHVEVQRMDLEGKLLESEFWLCQLHHHLNDPKQLLQLLHLSGSWFPHLCCSGLHELLIPKWKRQASSLFSLDWKIEGYAFSRFHQLPERPSVGPSHNTCWLTEEIKDWKRKCYILGSDKQFRKSQVHKQSNDKARGTPSKVSADLWWEPFSLTQQTQFLSLDALLGPPTRFQARAARRAPQWEKMAAAL